MRHLLNGSVPPETAADIYQRSKICLNIHGNGSTGVNPRTFEILACGAMEMVDVRGDYDSTFPPANSGWNRVPYGSIGR